MKKAPQAKPTATGEDQRSKHRSPKGPGTDPVRQVDAATLLNHSLNAFFLADRDGRILQVNKACRDMLAYTEKELLGMHVGDLAPDQKDQRIQEDLKHAAVTGITRGESQVATKGGHLIDIEYSVEHFPLAKSGLFFGCLHDVTERKRTERALLESETRWRALAESVNAAIFVFQDERFVYGNPAAEQIAGYARAELIGGRLKQLVRADFGELLERRAAARLRGEDVPSGYRVAIVAKDGREKWVVLSLARSEFNGRPAILGVAFDITEQVRTEEALCRSRDRVDKVTKEISRVEARERRELAQVLHDGVLQDLAACKLRLGNLRYKIEEEETRSELDYAMHILTQATREARQLTNRMNSPVLQEFGLDAALTDLCEQIRSEHGLAIQFVDDGRDKPLDDDALQILYRGVRGLAYNVVKHAEASQAWITSKLQDDSVTVTVRDNGRGFVPGSVGDAEREGSGGLGLHFLEQGLQRCAGTLELDSHPDRGTCAKIKVALPGHHDKGD